MFIVCGEVVIPSVASGIGFYAAKTLILGGEALHFAQKAKALGWFKYIRRKMKHEKWKPHKCPSCDAKQRSRNQASPDIEGQNINFHASGFIGGPETNFDRDDSAMNIHLNNGMIQPGCYDSEEDISQCNCVKITQITLEFLFS